MTVTKAQLEEELMEQRRQFHKLELASYLHVRDLEMRVIVITALLKRIHNRACTCFNYGCPHCHATRVLDLLNDKEGTPDVF